MEGSRLNYGNVEDGPLNLRQVRTVQLSDSDEPEVEFPNSLDSGWTYPGSDEVEEINGRFPEPADSIPGPTDFIQEMMKHIDLDLTDKQKQEVHQLLQDNHGVFSTSEFNLGRTDLVRHKIETGSNRPFKQHSRRHPMAYLPVIDEHVDKMLANKVCEPSNSPWASNVVLVKKVRRELRFCVDYRQLNNLKVKDSYPLPRRDTCFDALGDAKYFSTLDL